MREVIKIAEITETHEVPDGGNLIPLEIEMGGVIIKMGITCPACGNKKFWLSQDHSILYCGKCRTHIGYRIDDSAVTDGVKWDLCKKT